MNPLRFCLLVLIPLLAVGCGPSDPLDIEVDAGSPMELDLWRSRVGQRLTPGEWRDLETALQEVRYQIMNEAEASGRHGIDAAMRQKVDGRTVRFVLQLGFAARLMRLEIEEGVLLEKQAHNRRLKTRPGDEASADVLAGVIREIEHRLESLAAEKADARSKLERWVAADLLDQPQLPARPVDGRPAF